MTLYLPLSQAYIACYRLVGHTRYSGVKSGSDHSTIAVTPRGIHLPARAFLHASYMESACNRDGPRGGPKVMKPKNQKTEEFQSKELKFKVQKSD